MDMRTIRQKMSAKEWQERIYARQASGLTIAAWCKANGVSECSYYYWLRKLRKEAFESQETQLESQLVPTFCELSPVPNTLESQVDAHDEKIDSRNPSLILVNLKLPSLSLEVAGGVSPQEVKAALAVLKSLCY